jgi:hypothetical protein
VKGLALVLLLATPLAAGAQYAVPYRYPPPPPPMYVPPPPPPMVLPPPAPPLSPYYFNLGLGYGFGGTYQGDYWVPLSTYGSGGGLAYHVEAGARLMPQLLLGFDLSGLSTFGYGPYGGSAGVTLIDYDVVATLFPFVRGFFLRGGAGLSTLTTSVPVSGQYGVSTLGTNLLLGAGWAFPVALPLHFTLGMDWSHQFFGGADVTGSSIWMMRAGIGLY